MFLEFNLCVLHVLIFMRINDDDDDDDDDDDHRPNNFARAKAFTISLSFVM